MADSYFRLYLAAPPVTPELLADIRRGAPIYRLRGEMVLAADERRKMEWAGRLDLNLGLLGSFGVVPRLDAAAYAMRVLIDRVVAVRLWSEVALEAADWKHLWAMPDVAEALDLWPAGRGTESWADLRYRGANRVTDAQHRLLAGWLGAVRKRTARMDASLHGRFGSRGGVIRELVNDYFSPKVQLRIEEDTVEVLRAAADFAWGPETDSAELTLDV